MIDKRKSPRRRTFKGGIIVFSLGGGVNCTVRNLSDGGASLEIENQSGIPDNFILHIQSDRTKRCCRVVSRTKNRIGVAFEPE